MTSRSMPDASYVSHADLGGRGGFGPVVPEPNEPVFHASWERRAFALTLAMGATGSWNLDRGRATRETLPNYGELTYYEIWLAALEKLLIASGLVREAELAAGRALDPPAPIRGVLTAAQVPAALAAGSPTTRTLASLPKFAVGQRVRARWEEPAHHTRLPGYLRGRIGVIERIVGAHVFPDSNARGLGEDPQWLYTVVFEARDIWADRVSHRVSCDAWEPYLDPA
ncbi:MAG TPA: nitrile hydratase subunit beta [Steroidobacteraceae bacterium]|nr:nitrile hydratase subunit beta [Steroidobacteraceae bacterium]